MFTEERHSQRLLGRLDATLSDDLEIDLRYEVRKGATLTLHSLPRSLLFEPGSIFIPEDVLRIIRNAGCVAIRLIQRHLRNDGDNTWDHACNAQAIDARDGRVVSVFDLGPERIAVITYLGDKGYSVLLRV